MNIEAFWGYIKNNAQPLIEKLAPDDADQVMADADATFSEMRPDIPYRDKPDHPMASSMFFCVGMLAFQKALSSRSIDAHEFGSTMLEWSRNSPQAPVEEPDRPGNALMAAAEDSAQNAAADEFVFEVYEASDDDDFNWGMNIKSCAICKFFSRFDAMELVPYMCASDDIISDLKGQGLRRTGTIALGAGHCDFKFNAGGTGAHLSSAYPERIKIIEDFDGF